MDYLKKKNKYYEHGAMYRQNSISYGYIPIGSIHSFFIHFK